MEDKYFILLHLDLPLISLFCKVFLAQKDALSHDFGFWSKCANIVKLSEPFVHVLCIVDSENNLQWIFLTKPYIKLERKWRGVCHFNDDEFERHIVDFMAHNWDFQSHIGNN
ncbi:hypothetical protein CR513_54673, partial [Mucuna pruriens]